jgi:hypothetical protein
LGRGRSLLFAQRREQASRATGVHARSSRALLGRWCRWCRYISDLRRLIVISERFPAALLSESQHLTSLDPGPFQKFGGIGSSLGLRLFEQSGGGFISAYPDLHGSSTGSIEDACHFVAEKLGEMRGIEGIDCFGPTLGLGQLPGEQQFPLTGGPQIASQSDQCPTNL